MSCHPTLPSQVQAVLSYPQTVLIPPSTTPTNTITANYRMVIGSKMANVVNRPEGSGMTNDPNGSRMVDNT
jgi:hypothetical protein